MAATATPTTATNTALGLVVAATDPIRSFLSSAALHPKTSRRDIRDLASALSSEPAISYRSLRAIWCAASPDARPPLRDLLHGTEFVLRSPKPARRFFVFFCPSWWCPDSCGPAKAWVLIPIRLPLLQSAELKARLEKLREMQERREYAELVKDVVPPSKDDSPEPFSSYKDQIGFGKEQLLYSLLTKHVLLY
ncbi:hypothetical protein PR202_gb07563 [Eleusine coracana subsp. coracana]|uniref:Uncharacterized protein n=1 Tax=Eleusine coracana subsp. coracana TaxID=191504 RepID=A0AAV5EAR3_ELECO|nr:hypothetical protein PR202_gb07563 [Eleusine coracana subsp. coracana]